MTVKTDQAVSSAIPCAVDPRFDDADVPATAFRIDLTDRCVKVPRHSHRQGQLILALHGAVTCVTADRLWIVPPGSAVWIPGGMPHSNQTTGNARLVYLFIEPSEIALSNRCTTVSVSPMVREMILRLADVPDRHAPNDHIGRLIKVLLGELALMPQAGVELPVSDHPKIVKIAAALAARPNDRRTMVEWAKQVGMSERSLKRLIDDEIGLSFGRWRQRLHLIVALRGLANGESVKRIAADLGYESVTAFIIMFRKAMGTTPARYSAQGALVK